jgi:hypothetical protein
MKKRLLFIVIILTIFTNLFCNSYSEIFRKIDNTKNKSVKMFEVYNDNNTEILFYELQLVQNYYETQTTCIIQSYNEKQLTKFLSQIINIDDFYSYVKEYAKYNTSLVLSGEDYITQNNKIFRYFCYELK